MVSSKYMSTLDKGDRSSACNYRPVSLTRLVSFLQTIWWWTKWFFLACHLCWPGKVGSGPCGTPDVTSVAFEWTLSRATSCYLWMFIKPYIRCIRASSSWIASPRVMVKVWTCHFLQKNEIVICAQDQLGTYQTRSITNSAHTNSAHNKGTNYMYIIAPGTRTSRLLLRLSRCGRFLYACESWTTEIERKTQTLEMRCYRRLLKISYKDHVTKRRFATESRIQLECMMISSVAGPVGVRGLKRTPYWAHIISFSWGISGKTDQTAQTEPPQLIWTLVPKILDPPLLLTMTKKRKLRWYGHISRSSLWHGEDHFARDSERSKKQRKAEKDIGR